MQIEDEIRSDILNRLRRARGQVDGVIAMIEDGRNCVDIVTQLSAAAKALDRTGFKIIANGIRQCVAEESGAEQQDVTSAQLEKLFMSLA